MQRFWRQYLHLQITYNRHTLARASHAEVLATILTLAVTRIHTSLLDVFSNFLTGILAQSLLS